MRIEVADWTNTRTLTELPSEVAHALDYDLVLFSTDAAGGADARNTAGVMTLEALAKSRPDRRPRIVVEVDDVDLAARLNERFRSMGRHEIQVFSVDELRALLLFQSAAVAYFTEVFESLIQPGGRGLVPFRAKVGGPEQASFAALSWALRKEGRILVAVDEDNVVRLGSGFGREDVVSLDKARLWVVVAHGGQREPV